MIPLLLSTAAILAFLWYTRAPSRGHGVTPLSPEQREQQFRDRLDVAIGLRSEAYQRMFAHGAKAKRRMLAEIRNRAEQKTIQAGVPVVRRKLRLTKTG